MISIDLRHATIVTTPTMLEATLRLLNMQNVGSIDARMAAVMVVDQIDNDAISRACMASQAEIEAVAKT